LILSWTSPAGTEITFSRDSDTYKLLKNYNGLSTAPITHMTSTAPYQDGATRIDSKFEPRNVSFDVMVLAPTLEDLQWAIRILATSLNPLSGIGTLIYTQEDGSQFVLRCIGNNTPSVDPTQKSATHQLVTIDLIAFDPFWYSYPDTITYFGAGTPLTYPYAYPYAYPSSTASQTIQNAGNIAAGVTIVVTGEIVNPVITRTYVDEYGDTISEALSFTLSMAAGEVLTITTGFGEKTITLLHDNGTYDANPFQYLGTGSVFWQFVPGDNLVSVTNTSIAAATITSIQTPSKFSGV
jgi:hypothetical protein